MLCEKEKRKNKSLGILMIFLLGCLLSGCYGDYTEIAGPWQFKQVLIEENFGWALTTENEVLYTENGVEEFVPVKKWKISVTGRMDS